jgi:hypothetical protein
MADVGAIDHHAAKHGEFRNRRPDHVDISAELPPIERQRLQHAPAKRRALEI